MNNDISSEAKQFIKNANWGTARIVPLAQDASTRCYFRLHMEGKTAMLMQATTALDMDICPAGANSSERAAMGYNAEARLAGNDCSAFVGIANELTMRGFSAPRILTCNVQAGLILLEDLGEDLFYDVLQTHPDKEATLYEAAVLTLAALARASFGNNFKFQDCQWHVQSYDLQALIAETRLLDQWYLPFLGISPNNKTRAQLKSAWQQVLSPLINDPAVLVLRDFHAQNLIWLPKRDGAAKVGLLDFQDALLGHPAYDLVSLLQDARRDVAFELEQPMIDLFMESAKLHDRVGFLRAYRILGAQRAAKILGIFVRLARRDGKLHYLELLPRVEAHFMQNLQTAELQPVADILKPILAHAKPVSVHE